MESENKICGFLDWIGFVPEEIRWRRQVWSDIDTLSNIWRTIVGRVPVYITGSRPEGVGINALDSDTDVMVRLQNAHVIHAFKDWEHRSGVQMLLADTKEVHPGYCRLLVMDKDVPVVVEVSNHHTFITPCVEHNGVYVLPNNLTSEEKNTVCNGPANTKSYPMCDLDMVACITTAFPPCAREWLERNRPGQFPPNEFIRKSSRQDIFVVQTGYKNSEYPNLEWRFSFSLIELDIVLMWPDNVTRCYVLLKLLMKHISSVLPNPSGAISSYHVKTMLFWLTEEIGISSWDRNSLGECLMFSLKRLLFSIEQGCIPHYFIKDHNLFDLHVGTARQRGLASALHAMVLEGPACVFRCRYYQKLSVPMNWASVTYKSQYVRLERMFLNVEFVKNMIFDTITFSSDVNESITSLCKALNIVNGAISNYVADSGVAKGLDYMRADLQCTLATSILSLLLKHSVSNTSSYHLLRLPEHLLKISIHQHVGLLKMANFHYQTKQHVLAANVLQILSRMDMCRFVRWNYFTSSFYPQSEYQMLDLADIESPADFLSNKVSMSLMFQLPELHAAPYALKFEILQPKFGLAGGETAVPSHPAICFVDPVVYVYYLSYLCYESMGKRTEAQVAFDKLRSVAKQDSRIHQTTTWNLVGHCYFKQGKLRQAVKYLVKSVMIQRSRSVALVHLALVIKKAFAENNASLV